MIGNSEALSKIQDMIEKVAPSDARVLLQDQMVLEKNS
jgi:transcriptional regulator with GAF, ATPase, and Fis domain